MKKPPENLMVMGRIGVPFGIKGWVKVHPFTGEVDGLAGYPVWWLGEGGSWRECRVDAARAQGAVLVAKLAGVSDRDAAAACRGIEIGVPRDAFPAAGENEFYRADLIGMRVVNDAAVDFGVVDGVLETGANDVLLVREAGDGGRERLIPFVAAVVERVDIASGVITVRWGEDY